MCYQYGAKSKDPVYWNRVEELCGDFPACAANLFHISRSVDAVGESGERFICLLKGRNVPGYRCIENFPLLKNTGQVYGSCILQNTQRGIECTFYSRVIHVLKRHRISDLKIPSNVGACRALCYRLEQFRRLLGSDEVEKLDGYRMEFLCRGSSPISCLGLFEDVFRASKWIEDGALDARSITVGDYLDSIDSAIDFFKFLGVNAGDDKVPLSIFRKFICTDLLNFFGLCRGGMLKFLHHTSFEKSPFSIWEYWMANEAQLANRVGRQRYRYSRRVVSSRSSHPASRNPNNIRIRMDGFTEEEDRLILAAGQNWPRKGKWVRLKNSSPLFSTREPSQLQYRFKWLKKRISRVRQI